MPFLFIIAGVMFVVSGVRGTSSDLLALLKGDLTGQNNFLYWLISILIIGALGYIPQLRTLSRSFLILVIIGLVLHDGGFFNKFNSAIASISK